MLRPASLRKATARGSRVYLGLCAVLVAGHAGCRSVPKPAPDDGKVGDGQPSLTEKPPMDAAAAAKPALPPGVTLCEAATRQWGPWRAGREDIRAVALLLPKSCFDPQLRARAADACAETVGTTSVTVGSGSTDGSTLCQESFASASWGHRHWIVMGAHFFSEGTLSGGQFSVELLSTGPVLYLDNSASDRDCSKSARGARGTPADWATLPEDLAQFLCAN
ncbi:MAG: hypothetical protein JW940_03400 [Polyangiaceae bacterium]|nr:hypothetical protein [Polyangiaceae bacterium]